MNSVRSPHSRIPAFPQALLTMRLLLASLIAAASPALASAQSPAAPPASHTVEILPATRLATMADALPAGAMNSVPVGRWDAEGLNGMLGRRDSDGIPELHEGFTDIFVVQRGTATLRYGGTAVGNKVTTPGEWRGGTIQKGTDTVLHPGDVVVIPTGVPHQLLPTAGQHFIYLTFKVAKH
jgi:mannose-6-phosphate isomerase-like protein (cupin superfamily)